MNDWIADGKCKICEANMVDGGHHKDCFLMKLLLQNSFLINAVNAALSQIDNRGMEDLSTIVRNISTTLKSGRQKANDAS